MPDENDLRDHSDQLLADVDAIRDLERQKRTEPISTPTFHQLAEEIADRSRRIFSTAREEEAVGDGLPRQERTIDDVAKDGLA